MFSAVSEKPSIVSLTVLLNFLGLLHGRTNERERDAGDSICEAYQSEPPPLYIPCLCNVFCTLHAECTDVGYVGDVKHSISRAYPYMCCEHELCCDYFWSRWRASGCCHQLVFGSSHTLLLAVTLVTLAQKDSTKRWRNI